MKENFDKWCEQLLDTGRSNKLINYKDSKLRTLEVLAPNANTIFSKLRNGGAMSFYDVDEYLQRTKNEHYFEDEEEGQDVGKKVPSLSKKQIYDLLAKRIRNSEILSYKKGFTLKKVLGTIRKVAKESLVEKGINILYIAFGFLKWKESQDSDIWFTSPLNLVPIALENQAATEPYYMYQYEDEVSTNPTLVYKLKADFGIELPCLSDDGDLSSHLASIQKLVQSQGWEVVPDVAIGTFSFHKINMYNDLKNNEDRIVKNANVCRLLGKETKSTHNPIEEVIMEMIHKTASVSRETLLLMLGVRQKRLRQQRI